MELMELRKYQTEAVETIDGGWPLYPRQILTSFTGSGKTLMGSVLAHKEINAGGRVLWLCNRSELVRQAVDALEEEAEAAVGVEQAEQKSEGEPVVVGCVPSMVRRLGDQGFTMVIADECHFLPSESYSRVVNHYVGLPNEINNGVFPARAKLLGLTATPGREDKKELGIYFDRIGYQYGIPEGIRDQWIPPIRYERLDVAIDVDGVRTVEGEFDANQLAERLHPVFEEVVKVLADKLKSGHKTIIFVPLIEQSKILAGRLAERGIHAIHVDGGTPDVDRILDNFRVTEPKSEGSVDCLVNSQLVSFGVDLPCTDTLVFLKPVKSKVWYQQALGRGIRMYPGKEYLRVLDFVWLSAKGELMTPFSLTVGAHAAEEAERIAKENPEVGYAEAVEQATAMVEHRSYIAEFEHAILVARNKKERFPVLLDARMYAVLSGDKELALYEPGFGWERGKPTEKQLAALDRFKIDRRTVETQGYASKLLGRLIVMKNSNKPTAKGLYWLARMGVADPWKYSREEADRMIQEQKEQWAAARERRQLWSAQRR